MEQEAKIQMSKKEGSADNRELVVTKWVGLAGTGNIACRRRRELETRYPRTYIQKAEQLLQGISVRGEEIVLRKQPFFALHYLGTGGIYSGLWQFAMAYETGFEVTLEDIPIRQETIEICEYYDINPYMLDSTGSIMAAVEDGPALVAAMEQAGIPAVVIGRTVRGKGKLIRRDGEISCLERVVGDAGYGLLREPLV